MGVLIGVLMGVLRKSQNSGKKLDLYSTRKRLSLALPVVIGT